MPLADSSLRNVRILLIIPKARGVQDVAIIQGLFFRCQDHTNPADLTLRSTKDGEYAERQFSIDATATIEWKRGTNQWIRLLPGQRSYTPYTHSAY